jgi:hypothetical protein
MRFDKLGHRIKIAGGVAAVAAAASTVGWASARLTERTSRRSRMRRRLPR